MSHRFGPIDMMRSATADRIVLNSQLLHAQSLRSGTECDEIKAAAARAIDRLEEYLIVLDSPTLLVRCPV